MANGTIIKGNGYLPEIWVQNESLEEGGGTAGNDKGGTKIIYTNANTNTNANTSGAIVTVNSRAPEAPSDGFRDGRSYTYMFISAVKKCQTGSS